MERKVAIRVKDLWKIYRVGDEKVTALGGLNLEIYLGQIVCIVGTSGSGKSTLLNQLAGLEKPTKGSVFIGKTNISHLSEKQLAKFRQRWLGFIFQSYNLLPTMSALENVALPLIFKGVPKRKRNKTALYLLDEVGLKKRARHKPTQMSGGQQQRVGIARAFVTKPKVIFADEPTGNLDTKTTIEVMEMMVRFSRKFNQTLVIVTHDTELAEYADRVITLIDGHITSDVARIQTEEEPDPAQMPQQEQADSTADEPQNAHDGPPLPEEMTDTDDKFSFDDASANEEPCESADTAPTQKAGCTDTESPKSSAKLIKKRWPFRRKNPKNNEGVVEKL